MALPPRVFFTLQEASARWGCNIADIAGWAHTGRFRILTGIAPVRCGEEIIAGMVVLSPNRARLLSADWLPTKWDWVDPLKDANAEIAQIEAGLKSRTQAIAERGYDAEQVDREIAAEHARERALGLDFRRPGSPAQGVQSMPVEGDDPDQTDQIDDAQDLPRNEEDQP